jgi:hypothetical protein
LFSIYEDLLEITPAQQPVEASSATVPSEEEKDAQALIGVEQRLVGAGLETIPNSGLAAKLLDGKVHVGPSKIISSTDDPSAVGLHLRIITRLELAVERLRAIRASFNDSLSESTKGRIPITMLSETELMSLVRVCVRLSKLEHESGHLIIFIGASAGLE